MSASVRFEGNPLEGCVFCGIAAGTEPASIVWQSELILAVVDLRQFHPGHLLIMPRRHLNDVRELDPETGAALMAAVSRATGAVASAFPNQGLSVWHSIGKGANQEVPHLHIHVHPRFVGDGLLKVYPSAAKCPDRETLDEYAARLRRQMTEADLQVESEGVD